MGKTHSSLNSYYEYWDGFFRKWCNGAIEETYMPEPWWGWTPESRLPLLSVVINLHPAEDGEDQKRKKIKALLGNHTYREAMVSLLPAYLKKTEKWHSGRRAKSIRNALRANSLTLPEPEPSSASNLSIELSPLHSENSKGLEDYIKKNVDNVVVHTLAFAAEASKFIEGPLNSTVIVRCSAKRFCRMFESLGIKACNPDPELSRSPYRFNITRPDFEGVTFVCVWGAINNLPKKDLNEIINNLKQNNQ